MDSASRQRLLDFLKASFDPDGTVHILAVSATKLEEPKQHHPVQLKVRIALTLRDGDIVTPYFDGTDLLVAIHPDDIRFADEDGWADGPPIVEGSPNGLALGWVSELGALLWVSPEAQAEASQDNYKAKEAMETNSGDDFGTCF